VLALGQAELERRTHLVEAGDGLLPIDPSLDAWHFAADYPRAGSPVEFR
jgi:hypothetical protein